MKTKTSAVVVGGLLTLLLWTIAFVGLNRLFQGRFPSVPVGWLLIGLAALLCPLTGGNIAARLAPTHSLRLGALTGASAGLVVLLAVTWMLDSLHDNSPIADTEIALYFEETHLGGTMTCNQYGGTRDTGKYTATDDGTLAILQLAVTVQLCSSPEGLMEQEAAYIEALQSAATYRVTDHRLEIADASGKVMLVYTRFESAM